METTKLSLIHPDDLEPIKEASVDPEEPALNQEPHRLPPSKPLDAIFDRLLQKRVSPFANYRFPSLPKSMNISYPKIWNTEKVPSIKRKINDFGSSS
jgi:hypothetical protein